LNGAPAATLNRMKQSIRESVRLIEEYKSDAEDIESIVEKSPEDDQDLLSLYRNIRTAE
jgi:hypothetical protein